MFWDLIHIAACCLTSDSAVMHTPVEPITPGDTVFIKVERNDFATIGRKQNKISINESPQTVSQNLWSSGQFFKEYGVSGSSTISKRGADATQTQVLWNGLPINHPMLGMMDFNSGSTFGMDELILIEGGNSAIYGSGSVGGTVLLNNQLKFGQNRKFQVATEFNSLQNGQIGLRAQESWENTYFDISYSAIDRKNKFDFFDPIQEKSRETFNMDLNVQTLRLVAGQRYKNQQIKGVLERTVTSRGLGFVLGSEQVLGQQFDVHWRSLLQHDLQLKGWHLTQKLGKVEDQLIYLQPAQPGDTSKAQMYFFQSECYQLTKWGKHLFGLDYQIQKGNTRFYENTQIRYLPALFYALNGSIHKTNYLFNIRYEFHEKVMTGGVGTQTLITKQLKFKTDIHRSFRRPTLNDLYWYAPSRNIIVSETGWSAEIGLLWSSVLKGIHFQAEITPFYRELNHPIIWLPNGAFWAAKNLFHGQYWGLQSSAMMNLNWRKHQFKIQQELEWVRTQVQHSVSSERKHQIFVPDLMSATHIFWNYGTLMAHGHFQHTGNRYIATDNSDWMPMYSLWGFEISKKWSMKWITLNTPFWTSIGAQNLGNTIYQNMPGRPMPPRNFYLKLNITF